MWAYLSHRSFPPQSASTHLDCLLGLYWTGLNLLNGFYPRDVYVSAVFATDGWVSVTCRYCIKTAKPILKLFRPSGSPIILVFLTLAPIPNSKGNPFSGGYKYKGYGKLGKIWLFSTEIVAYFGNGARQADGYYGTLIGSHGCRINGMFDDLE